MEPRIDALQPLSALELLSLWQERRESAEDGLERSILCNAKVLARCCYFQGERVFADEWAVLSALTARQMERLLLRLAGEDTAQPRAETENPGFDQTRFDALKEA